MYPKNIALTPLLTICCILIFYCSEATATYCSLDRMKKFAMEACEHLFEFETEARERRSLEYGIRNHQEHIHLSKYSLNIRRSIYPVGGYLKVGKDHYKKLTLLDVSPRYKAKKMAHIMHEKKLRNKREDSFHNYSNNISYCCYHKCEEDFFC